MRSAIVGSRGDAITVETDLDALVEELAVEAETVADATLDRELRQELRASLQRWPVDSGQSRARLGLRAGSFSTKREWVASAMAPYSAYIRTAGHGVAFAGGGRGVGEQVSWVRFELPMRLAAQRGLAAVADEITKRGGGGR